MSRKHLFIKPSSSQTNITRLIYRLLHWTHNFKHFAHPHEEKEYVTPTVLSAPTRCAVHTTPTDFQFYTLTHTHTHRTKNLASSLRRTNSAAATPTYYNNVWHLCESTLWSVLCRFADGHAKHVRCGCAAPAAAAATAHTHAFGVTTTTSTSRRKHITTLIHDYPRAARASDVGRRSEHSLRPASTAGINNNNGSQQQQYVCVRACWCCCCWCWHVRTHTAWMRDPFGRAGNEWRAFIVYRSAPSTRSIRAAVHTISLTTDSITLLFACALSK